MHGAHLWRQHKGVRSGADLKFRERAADGLKMAFGTWSLLGLIVAAIVFWMLRVHDPGELHLNLGLSFLASVQGVILQIAANRGDRINAEVALHTQGNTDTLLEVNRRQLEVLERLDGLQDTVGNLADVVQQVLAAREEHGSAVLAEAKAARTAAESAFVGVRALAAVAPPAAVQPQPLPEAPPVAPGGPGTPGMGTRTPKGKKGM